MGVARRREHRAAVGEEVMSVVAVTASGEGGNIGHWRRCGRAVGPSGVQEGEKLETKASMGGDKMWWG